MQGCLISSSPYSYKQPVSWPASKSLTPRNILTTSIPLLQCACATLSADMHVCTHVRECAYSTRVWFRSASVGNGTYRTHASATFCNLSYGEETGLHVTHATITVATGVSGMHPCMRLTGDRVGTMTFASRDVPFFQRLPNGDTCIYHGNASLYNFNKGRV